MTNAPTHAPCRLCAAFAFTDPSRDLGECRRRAPTLANDEAFFPPVRVDHWCAEWLPSASDRKPTIGEIHD